MSSGSLKKTNKEEQSLKALKVSRYFQRYVHASIFVFAVILCVILGVVFNMDSSSGNAISTRVVGTQNGNNTVTSSQFEEIMSSFVNISISSRKRDQFFSSNLDMLMANNDQQSIVISSICPMCPI